MNDDGGKEGKIHHGGNPVLMAAALGAAVVPDVAGNLDRLSGAGGNWREEVPIHYRTLLKHGRQQTRRRASWGWIV
jgi:hypothetical protein